MSWGAILSGVSGVAGALFDDSGDVERENRRNQDLAHYSHRRTREEITATEELALSDIDAANLMLADLEDDQLSVLDERTRILFTQAMLQQEADFQAEQQRLAVAGLDSSTVSSGIAQGRRFGQAQQLGQLTASMAGVRAGALSSARNAAANGLFQRANALTGFGMARANSFAAQGNLYANTQVQGSGIGAAIGQIGGSIGNAIYQSEIAGILGGLGGPSAAQASRRVQNPTEGIPFGFF